MYLSTLFVTLFAAVAVQGYPTGAPPSVCESMMPGHGVHPQTSPSPYKIILEKSKLEGGESMRVTIKGQNGIPFRGYLLEARDKDENIIGTFSVSGDAGKLLDCGDGKENAVSHSNPSDKKEVTLTWYAPKDVKGEVNFYATVVQVFEIFWVKQKSAALTIS